MKEPLCFIGSERHPVYAEPRWRRLLRMESPLSLQEVAALCVAVVVVMLLWTVGMLALSDIRQEVVAEDARVAAVDHYWWRGEP